MPPDTLIERAVDLDLEGTPVKVVSLPDLIALKRASGRTQDGDDADILERMHDDDDDATDPDAGHDV